MDCMLLLKLWNRLKSRWESAGGSSTAEESAKGVPFSDMRPPARGCLRSLGGISPRRRLGSWRAVAGGAASQVWRRLAKEEHKYAP